MSGSSVLPPALTRPSCLCTGSGPRPTLPPALLHKAATGTVAPLQSNKPTAAVSGQPRKKRRPPLPPSGNGGAKKPKTAQQTPSAPCRSSGMVDTATAAERKRALDKKVAGCLLTRSWAGDAAARHKEGLYRLHQDDLGPPWMDEQKAGVPAIGGDGEALVPTVRAGDRAEVVVEYAGWRQNVRVPSRFYKEHVRAIDAGQYD